MTTTELAGELTGHDVRELLLAGALDRVSILVPLHPVGREADQDPLVLKNVLHEARERLMARGLRGTEADDRLEWVITQSRDPGFRRNGRAGLALYGSVDEWRSWYLPYPVGPLVTVSPRFQVKPLFPMITDNETFLVVALSRSAVRVFRGSRFGIEVCAVPNLPTDQKSFLHLDRPQQQLQYRTASARTGGAGGRSGAMIHGHGSKDEATSNLHRYVHAVDVAVSRFVGDREVPLVLAGVEKIVAAYHARTSYRGLLSEWVAGNPDALPAEELNRLAWPLVASRVQAAMLEQADHCRSLLETEHRGAAAGVEAVLPAADSGHVDTLFVALDRECWGEWNPAAASVKLHDHRDGEDEDLLNAAAALTYQHGGTVYAVPAGDVPGGGSAAALFRF